MDELTRATEELAVFRKMADASGEGFGIADMDGIYRYVNPAMCRLLGLDGPEELVGKDYLPTFTAEARRFIVEEGIPRALREGHWTGELPMLTKQGGVVPTFHSTVVIRDEKGEPFRVATIVSDLSERKASERQLAHFSAIVRSSRDAITGGSVDGTITIWNAAAERLYGYTAEEAIGQSILSCVPPDRVDETKGLLARVAQGEGVEAFETVRRRKDGTLVDISLTLSPIRDAEGRVVGASAVVRDITERKKAEEALRHSHDHLQAIYDGMTEGLVILDSETMRIVRVNSALCRMLGYAEEELLSMSIADIHPPDEAPTTLGRIRERAGGGLREHTDVPVLRSDGGVFYADVAGNPLVYGGRLCVLGLFRDVSERRAAQAALVREHQTLKHLLQSSDHERQLIAYEIHDGLAQYLAASLMQFDVYNHLKEDSPAEAARAYAAATTMLHQAYADARRLISGVRPPILDEEGIVAAIAHLMNEQRMPKGPKIEFRSSVEFDRLVPIVENAIYRIVQEALTNACKHSKSPRVQLELLQEERQLRIKVEDWGVGFDPDKVEESHFGLSGMRQRARLLGGNISIDSAPGEGTRVVAELPLVMRDGR